MKIKELILEFELPVSLRDIPVLDIFGSKVTAGTISDAIPGVDPATVVKYGKKINDVIQTKITPNYTVADALVDVATIIPAARAVKGAKTVMGAVKGLGSHELRRELGHAAVRSGAVKFMPDAGASPAPTSDVPTKQRKYKIGDKIPVNVKGKTHSLPVKNVIPNGYEVDASNVPGSKPGTSLTVPEPL